MADRTLRSLGKVLLARSTEEMLTLAKRYKILDADGRIDLRERAVKLDHSGLDLSAFVFHRTQFRNSRLTNCSAEGVNFAECRFIDCYISNEGTTKTSFAKARFDGAYLQGTSFGPRTLDMSQTSFNNAELIDVDFRMGKLLRSSFRGAKLTDVYFRSALLHDVDFSDAVLRRVSFEKADLQGTDFSSATGIEMDFWGHEDLFPPSSSESN